MTEAITHKMMELGKFDPIILRKETLGLVIGQE